MFLIKLLVHTPLNSIFYFQEKSKNVALYLRIKCPICFENINKESASSTKCGHVFCTTCLTKALRRMPVCPTCRTRLKGPSGHHTLYLDSNVCEEVDIKSEIKAVGIIPAAAVDKLATLETVNNLR